MTILVTFFSSIQTMLVFVSYRERNSSSVHACIHTAKSSEPRTEIDRDITCSQRSVDICMHLSNDDDDDNEAIARATDEKEFVIRDS